MLFQFLWISFACLITQGAKDILTRVLAFLAIVYLGYSGARVFIAPFSPFGKFANLFDPLAAGSLAWVVISLALFTQRDRRALAMSCFKSFAMINSVCLITGLRLGLLDNLALDASLIVLTYPFLDNRPLKGIALLGILCSKSSSGIFGLVAYFLSRIRSLRQAITVTVIVGVLIAIGYLTQGSELLWTNHRSEIWKESLTYWFGNIKTQWIGTGLGSFEILGPEIQKSHGATSGFFVYAHNEWVQVLFEQGFIGITLMILFYFKSLINNLRNKDLLSSLVVMGVLSCSQSILRVPLLSILVVLILIESNMKEKEEEYFL